jgi:hypothetical protein
LPHCFSTPHPLTPSDDVHEQGTEGDAGWQIYYPITQNFPNAAQLVIRTTLPPISAWQSWWSRSINPTLPR